MEKEINVKKQLKISIPIALEDLINILMTLVDTIVISTIGIKELGAIGAMAVIINIMQISTQTMNVINSSLVAKSIGEKDEQKIKLTSGNSMILTFIISIISIVLVYVISPIFPQVFNVDVVCNTYLAIRLIGFIQNSIVTVLSGHQRTLGKQGTILKVRIIAVVLNLIFDIIAVNLQYGIEGVAWVTIIIDTFLAMYLIIISKKTIRYKFDLKIIKGILKLFKWNFLERIVSRIDNFVFNILVSRIGPIEYAAHVILIQIRDITEAFIQGFGDGITISVGIASGNKIKSYMETLKKVARKIINYSAIIIPICTFIIGIIVMKISLKQLNTQVIFLEVLPLLIIGNYIVTSGTYYYSMIRGIRDFKFLAQRNFITSIIKIIIATILSFTPLGVIGVWISYLVYSIMQKYLSWRRYEKLSI